MSEYVSLSGIGNIAPAIVGDESSQFPTRRKYDTTIIIDETSQSQKREDNTSIEENLKNKIDDRPSKRYKLTRSSSEERKRPSANHAKKSTNLFNQPMKLP